MSDLPRREFGNTGLTVSALGFGASQIGAARLTERDVEVLLNAVLDHGVSLIDLDHLRRTAEFVAKGPLPDDLIDVIRQTFKANDQNWIGQN